MARLFPLLAAALALLGAAPARQAPPAVVPLPSVGGTPFQRVTVVHAYPHDPDAFTEGLLWRDGTLYESTGLEGHSDIRRVRLADGRVLARTTLAPSIFGEGIVAWRDQLISLTWKAGTGYRWNRATLKQIGEFRYPGEGWGLTDNGTDLIQSDGTAQLRFLDPATYAERRRITVHLADGRPLGNVNELEWVRGEILANVWQTDNIARIDPATGLVTALLDLSPVHARVRSGGIDAVLNGIAYDAAHDRLFVTGKNWPTLFEIKISPPPMVKRRR